MRKSDFLFIILLGHMEHIRDCSKDLIDLTIKLRMHFIQHDLQRRRKNPLMMKSQSNFSKQKQKTLKRFDENETTFQLYRNVIKRMFEMLKCTKYSESISDDDVIR